MTRGYNELYVWSSPHDFTYRESQPFSRVCDVGFVSRYGYFSDPVDVSDVLIWSAFDKNPRRSRPRGTRSVGESRSKRQPIRYGCRAWRGAPRVCTGSPPEFVEGWKSTGATHSRQSAPVVSARMSLAHTAHRVPRYVHHTAPRLWSLRQRSQITSSLIVYRPPPNRSPVIRRRSRTEQFGRVRSDFCRFDSGPISVCGPKQKITSD